MKHLLCFVLTVSALLSMLPGCAQKLNEPVTFYYLKSSYQETMDSPIVGEEREVAGHRDNLKYLLSFYLMGPIGKELSSPLPRGTQLYTVEQEGPALTIEISDTSALLNDADFSLACACLSTTCMGLVNAEKVTIVSGSKSLTLSRDNLLLNDTITPEETAK
ncbi:MAG: hypothetical protein MR762_14135 [Clostridiales bacterium]|nr:hypothetical protein [Clostridiales bacterium]MDD5883029.1 hypothetical protein [Bacillota bacterium]